MGGDGSGRKPDVVKAMIEARTPIAVTNNGTGIFLPNYSGVQEAALKTSAPLGTGGGAESDPVFLALSGGFLTSYTETDPRFLALSGGLAYIPTGTNTEPVFLATSGSFLDWLSLSGGMSITNDGTKTTFLGTAGDYNRIGDAATTTMTTPTNDDLLITGRLDLAGGQFHFSSPTDNRWGQFMFKENGVENVNFNANWLYNHFSMGLGEGAGRSLILCDQPYYALNFDHGTQTNPTLYIQSATDPDTNNTKWLSLTHDQTNGVITTGNGALIVASASGSIGMPNAAVLTPTIQAATMSGSLFCSGGLLWYKSFAGNYTRLSAT